MLTIVDPQQICRAYRIGGAGATPLTWEEAIAAEPTREEWVWMHFERSDARARHWLEHEAGLSEDLYWALVDDDTQPRAAVLDDGVLLILRGCNRESKSEMDELVSLRVYVTETRVLSVRLRPFAPTYELAERIEKGRGPTNTGAFLDQLVETTLEQLEALLDKLGARIDVMEDLSLAAPTGELRTRRAELNELKRAVLVTRRYLQPQREALAHLVALSPSWFHPRELPSLSEAAAQAGRIVSDYDALRDRLTLIGDEMHARMAERMNRAMLTLAVVSTVFMPLTFVTGLLGVNLAGIPFAAKGWAFGALSALLVVIAGVTGYFVARINRP